jgi:hypothetical protein
MGGVFGPAFFIWRKTMSQSLETAKPPQAEATTKIPENRYLYPPRVPSSEEVVRAIQKVFDGDAKYFVDELLAKGKAAA